jgi:hypothetical protein
VPGGESTRDMMVHMMLVWLIGVECMRWYRKTCEDSGKSVGFSGKNQGFQVKTSMTPQQNVDETWKAHAEQRNYKYTSI